MIISAWESKPPDKGLVQNEFKSQGKSRGPHFRALTRS